MGTNTYGVQPAVAVTEVIKPLVVDVSNIPEAELPAAIADVKKDFEAIVETPVEVVTPRVSKKKPVISND